MENPNLLALAKEVVEQSEVLGSNVGLQCDLGRVVGQTSCIETTAEDEIVYAKRLQRDSYSRFVKNRQLEDTSIVSVVQITGILYGVRGAVRLCQHRQILRVG